MKTSLSSPFHLHLLHKWKRRGGTSDIFPELEPDPRAQTRGGLFPSSAPLGCGAGRVSNPGLVQPSALRGGLLTTP